MPAGTFNLTGADRLEQGATALFTVTWKNSAGEVYDLSSNYTATLSVSESLYEPPALTATSDAGDITLDASTNITVVLSDELTTVLDFTSGFWELVLTNTSTGVVTRLLEGTVEITLSVEV
jgi:hypothetical protein